MNNRNTAIPDILQQIPWSNLPALRSMAGDYYNKLAYHTSWLMVHWKFITQPTIGPQSRVIRTYGDHKKGRSLLGKMRDFDILNKKYSKLQQICHFFLSFSLHPSLLPFSYIVFSCICNKKKFHLYICAYSKSNRLLRNCIPKLTSSAIMQ